MLVPMGFVDKWQDPRILKLACMSFMGFPDLSMSTHMYLLMSYITHIMYHVTTHALQYTNNIISLLMSYIMHIIN